jgi:hypothetical protein
MCEDGSETSLKREWRSIGCGVWYREEFAFVPFEKYRQEEVLEEEWKFRSYGVT